MTSPTQQPEPQLRVGSDVPFYVGLAIIGGSYVLLLAGMIISESSYTSADNIWAALQSREIQYSIKLSLISCAITAILSLWVSVPIGYVMSRHRFPGKALADAILDIPIVLPPLVVGLCLLILFEGPTFTFVAERLHALEQLLGVKLTFPVTFEIPAVILAQFMVACAFAVRTMRVTFDQLPTRFEEVALTLGCNRSQAFWRVVLPQCRRGMLAAGTLAWARALGEFGPILIFAGSTRMKTEVLSTTVFLELTVGNIEGAVAASLIMIFSAITVLVIARVFGLRRVAF